MEGGFKLGRVVKGSLSASGDAEIGVLEGFQGHLMSGHSSQWIASVWSSQGHETLSCP